MCVVTDGEPVRNAAAAYDGETNTAATLPEQFELVFDAMKIVKGKAIISFKHAHGGLVARPLPATYHPNMRQPELPPKPLELPSPGSELQGFTICDTTHHWVNAQAKIEGATVVVWSDDVKQSVAVRFVWAHHPVCNLYNRAGLPEFPFRTDRTWN